MKALKDLFPQGYQTTELIENQKMLVFFEKPLVCMLT